jgi:hypothetical protein
MIKKKPKNTHKNYDMGYISKGIEDGHRPLTLRGWHLGKKKSPYLEKS